MEEKITIIIPDISFSTVIEAKTNKFIKCYFVTTDLINEANYIISVPKTIKQRITEGLNEYQTNENKVAFLTQLLNHFINLLPKFKDGSVEVSINNLEYIHKTIPFLEEIIFEITQSIEALGLGISQNTFTGEEYNRINNILEEVLGELNIIKTGNAVLGEQIEELQNDIKDLKTSLVMGKKPFHQRVTGIITNYVANKGADEVFEKIKPLLFELIHGFIKQNNLENVIKLLN